MKRAIYLLTAITIGLVSLTIYSTYAMFTSSVSSDTVLNLDTTINYEFAINGVKRFTLDAKTTLSFNMTIKNNTSKSLKYGIYHNYTGNGIVKIGEVVADATTVTTATNTTGTLTSSQSKTIPVAIVNETSNTITIDIGLVTDESSLTYPTNASLITSTVDDDELGTGACASRINYQEEDCYNVKESGYINTYCTALVNSSTINNLDTSGANIPELADGMIPIRYNGSTWVKADKLNESTTHQWYDYNAKKWANAVMVTSGTRDTYMNADLGTSISESDILAYYVWIPRYKYQLFNVDTTTMDPIEIQVTFEGKNVTKSSGTANGDWLTHPAFTFGTDELSGVWVGKFSTTGSAETPTIKPNIGMLTNQNVSTQFTTSQIFGTTTYLTSTGASQVDAHMMKNIEWGAVAYLKQSKYGLGTTDIGLNNYSSSPFLTGCGSTSGSSFSSTCNAYNTTDGMLASTTGNITGVYDMSAAMGTYVMGVMQDNTGTNTPMSGDSSSYNSGFTGKIYDSGNFTDFTGTPFPNTKYYDLYAYGTSNSDYTRRILGDATGEVNGWYGDIADFVGSGNPWFVRGRSTNTTLGHPTYAGVFAFYWSSGKPIPILAFRSVLAPGV